MTITMNTISSELITAMPLAVSRLSRRLPVTDGTNAFYLEHGHVGRPWGLTLSVRKIGENVTNDDYDEYLARLDTFRTWFEKTVMSLGSESGDIMVLPAGIAALRYRDEPPR